MSGPLAALWGMTFAATALARFWAVGCSLTRRRWFWPISLLFAVAQALSVWWSRVGLPVPLAIGLYLLAHCALYRARNWEVIGIALLMGYWEALLLRLLVWGWAALLATSGAGSLPALLHLLGGGAAICVCILWTGRVLARRNLATWFTRRAGYGLAVLALALDTANRLAGDTAVFTGSTAIPDNIAVALCAVAALTALLLFGLGRIDLPGRQGRLSRVKPPAGWQAHQRLRHDLHNHLATAQGLLRQGHSGQAARYAAALQARIDALPRTEWCADPGVNRVLFARLPLLEARGISLVVDTRPVDVAPPLMHLADKLCRKALAKGKNGDQLLLRLRVQNGLAVAELSGLRGKDHIRLVRTL